MNSLSADFIQFSSNYIMKKLDFGLFHLLNELQTFESIQRQGKNKGSTNVTDQKKKAIASVGPGLRHASSSKRKRPAKDDKKKKNNNKKPAKANEQPQAQALAKGTCFPC